MEYRYNYFFDPPLPVLQYLEPGPHVLDLSVNPCRSRRSRLVFSEGAAPFRRARLRSTNDQTSSGVKCEVLARDLTLSIMFIKQNR